jgi:hypothetical protein
VTALHRIEARDQTASLPSSPDARARAVDRQDAPVNTVGQLVDGRSAATADRGERSSTLVRVGDLLTSDAIPPVHQATSTRAPGTGRIPRQPGDAELQRAPGQTSSLGSGSARRPGRPHSQGVHGHVQSSLQNHGMSDAPPSPPDSADGPLRPERRAAPPNRTIPAPLGVPAEAQMAFCRPSPRRPPRSEVVASLERAATTYPVVRGSEGEGQFISHKLRELGQLLLARRGVAGLWSVDVDVLMRQDAPRFFNYCCWFMGLPRISRLSVKLPSVCPQETYFVHRQDLLAFEDLKRIILEGLLVLLRVQPGLQCFRIEVAPFHGPYYEKTAVRSLETGRNRPGALRPTATAVQPTMVTHPSRHSAPYGIPSSHGSSGLQTHLVVRIQQNERGGFSCRYQGTILDQGVTSAYFFSWFAERTGYHDPLGPFELEFYFKDALPARTIVIARGNEAYFQSMQQAIPLSCEQTAAQMPDLFEFAILVRAPGWAGREAFLSKG